MRTWAMTLAVITLLLGTVGCASWETRVDSIPQGANVLVDGKLTGQVTPASLPIGDRPGGYHTITVEKEGYKLVSPPQNVQPSTRWIDTFVLLNDTPNGQQAEGSTGSEDLIRCLGYREKYGEMPFTVNVHDIPLAEAVRMLVEEARLGIERRISPGGFPQDIRESLIVISTDRDFEGRVTCSLPYTTFEKALGTFLRLNGYGFTSSQKVISNENENRSVNALGGMVLAVQAKPAYRYAQVVITVFRKTDVGAVAQAPVSNSAPRTTPASPAAPASPKPPVAYSDNSSVAVVIGISDYVFLGRIPGCDADATAFAEAFRETRRMNPRNVVLMTDSGDKSHEPTKLMIESRIKMCVNEAKPDGMALVYFSGHAVTQDGQALLVPKDSDATNGIPVNTVVAMLRESPARDKVLIIDACHAGAAQKGVLVIARDAIKEADGVAMFLSCDQEESSYPLENGEKSVYTDAFLRCLQEAASGSTPITARLLEGKIEEKMRAWRLETGKRQTPQFKGDGGVTLVPVGTKR